MHHSKAEILRDLDPTNPATVQALIDFHRATFGGWKMEGDENGGDKPDEGEKPDDKGEQKGDKGGDDKPLGPNGEKALKAEREARETLEKQLNQLKSGLATALGVDQKDAKSSTDDVLASVQQQLAAMQHANLVLSVANSHKITDEDDLALLRSIQDEEAVRKLAARLKPSDDAQGGQSLGKRRIPAPDPSQGKGSGSDSRATGVSAGADLFANRKTKTTTKE